MMNFVQKKLSELCTDCVLSLSKSIVGEESEAVTYGILQWAGYQCNNFEIHERIRSHLSSWSKNTGIPSFISEIDSKIQELKTELNEEFNKEHKAVAKQELGSSDFVKSYELLKQDDQVFLSGSKQSMPLVFDFIVNWIADHYRDNPIWNNFPNDKKGWISDPRPEFLKNIAEIIAEWIQKEQQSTIEVYCIPSFFEVEFDVNDDLKTTFFGLFVMEGCFDLINIMKHHKKEILGRLVLEEYLDDDD